MTRRLVALLTVMLLGCSALVAGGNPAVGKWDCVSDDGHGAVLKWTLSLKESEGRLSGVIREGEAVIPLIDAAFDGKILTFKTVINQNCTVKYNLKIEGDKLDGSFECPEASGTMKGTRQKQASGA